MRPTPRERGTGMDCPDKPGNDEGRGVYRQSVTTRLVRVVQLACAYATAWLLTARRFSTASARARRAVTVVSQPMQPSVMDWP
jgi:hypothetical protein